MNDLLDDDLVMVTGDDDAINDDVDLDEVSTGIECSFDPAVRIAVRREAGRRPPLPRRGCGPSKSPRMALEVRSHSKV